MIAVEIDGPVGVRFVGCRFESGGLGILATGQSNVTVQKSAFSVGDQPVLFDSDGALVLERNTWCGDGVDDRPAPFLAPAEWLVLRIVERHFGR